MKINDIANQKIGIVGFGEENRQFVTWLLSQNSKNIVVFDKNNCTEKALEFGIKNVFWGTNYLQDIGQCDIIFKAPGIYSRLPEFEQFKKSGKLVLSSLQYFIDAFANQIIAVTGTKGKTTTSSLIAHLLSKSGKTVRYCGNTTGISPYQFWNEKDSVFVLELSSFQLQDLQDINPKVSVVTNYYLDHQDQHISPQEYWASKDRIFEFQTNDNFAILNGQISAYSQMQTMAQKIIINQKLVNFVSFRVQSPLLGEHNLYNLTIALGAVLTFLTGDFDISNLTGWTEKLVDYKGIEMRLEKFAQNSKITVYDDGAATEPQAVISAIKALTANLNQNQKLWLWISGKDKGGDLQELADLIKHLGNKIKVEYCGEVGQNLAKLVGEELQTKQSLKEKLENLNIGDFEGNICLSPCGSSFDEFDNYKQRSALWKTTFDSVEKFK